MLLSQSGTWEEDKKNLGCKWVFTIKSSAEGNVQIIS